MDMRREYTRRKFKDCLAIKSDKVAWGDSKNISKALRVFVELRNLFSLV